MHPFKTFSLALVFSVGCRAAKVAEGATDDVDTAAPDDAAEWWEEGTEEPDGDETESDDNPPDDADDESDDKPDDWTDDTGDKPDDWDDDSDDWNDNSEDKPDDWGGNSGYESCGDDFDPNAPCSGDWTETICVHESMVWWCEDGTWANEDDKP